MAVRWGVNIIIGFTAFLLTYVFSFVNNTWQTSLFRAGIGFILFLVLGFILQIFFSQKPVQNDRNGIQVEISDDGRNQEPEMTSEMDDSKGEEAFQALPLQSLHDLNGELPKDIAQTIKSWINNDEEG